jgi:hypothetical protein
MLSVARAYVQASISRIITVIILFTSQNGWLGCIFSNFIMA